MSSSLKVSLAELILKMIPESWMTCWYDYMKWALWSAVLGSKTVSNCRMLCLSVHMLSFTLRFIMAFTWTGQKARSQPVIVADVKCHWSFTNICSLVDWFEQFLVLNQHSFVNVFEVWNVQISLAKGWDNRLHGGLKKWLWPQQFGNGVIWAKWPLLLKGWSINCSKPMVVWSSVSTVATDGLVPQHQAISTYSADLVFYCITQDSYKNVKHLHVLWTSRETKIHFAQNHPVVLGLTLRHIDTGFSAKQLHQCTASGYLLLHLVGLIWHTIAAGRRFNIKMSYRYRKFHCGDKTVVRSSYLHNGISYTGKMTSFYWIRALVLELSPVYY